MAAAPPGDAARDPSTGAAVPQSPLDQLLLRHPRRAVTCLRSLVMLGVIGAVVSGVPSVAVLLEANTAPFICNTALRVWAGTCIAVQVGQIPLRLLLWWQFGQAAAQRRRREVGAALLRISHGWAWRTNQKIGLAVFGWFVVGGGMLWHFWSWKAVSTSLLKLVFALLCVGSLRLAATFSLFYTIFVRPSNGALSPTGGSSAALASLRRTNWSGSFLSAHEVPVRAISTHRQVSAARARHRHGEGGGRARIGEESRGRPDKPEEQVECSICMTEFEEGVCVIFLQCHRTHVFHDECLTTWLRRDMTCPTCRTVVETSDSDGENVQ